MQRPFMKDVNSEFQNFARTGIVVLFFLFLSISSFTQTIPEHSGKWVVDEAGILSPQTEQQLEVFLKRDRDSTSNQIAVYIKKNLDGGDIDEYANRVFNKWALGEKEKDNGVLLLIALDERRVRIEVGAGLEGALTDLQASRINRNEIAPRFRAGDYDGGVKAGVLAIVQSIKGEYVNEDPQQPRRSKAKRNSPLFTVFLILMVIIFLSRRRGGRGGGGYWSSGSGWIGPIGGGGFGSSSGSWGGGADFGGGGFSGGGGSSGSW